ncbi:t-complex protein 1 subunit eta [Hordeum vulgare]|nr:t-complex protein 1 subunit eta [Hordeum vulgare]
MRLVLGAFNIADQAARAYDAAVWRLNRPLRDMIFLEDILDEREFFMQRRTERAAYREDMHTRKQTALFNMKLKGASTWSFDDERWADAFITTEESDTSASKEDDEE